MSDQQPNPNASAPSPAPLPNPPGLTKAPWQAGPSQQPGSPKPLLLIATILIGLEIVLSWLSPIITQLVVLNSENHLLHTAGATVVWLGIVSVALAIPALILAIMALNRRQHLAWAGGIAAVAGVAIVSPFISMALNFLLTVVY